MGVRTRVTTGQWVLLLAVGLAVAFGAWRALTDGRFRGSATPSSQRVVVDADERVAQRNDEHETQRNAEHETQRSTEREAEGAGGLLAGTEYADQLGERATLLQFSSAFCAPCRATRRTLAEVTELVADVAHVEVDAESHLELVRRLGITRTPTTVVLDPTGHEVTRAAGAPGKQQVLSALSLVGPTQDRR